MRYEIKGKKKELDYLLKKSLYRLKQSPRKCYKRFDDFIMKIDFVRSLYNNYAYYKMLNDKNYVYLLLYVNEMQLASFDTSERVKDLLNAEFNVRT